jgi:sugar phosphate isomerase/epimerase
MFTPSASTERVAVQWDRYSRRSIDFAKQVGAAAVVAHLGAVEHGWANPTRTVRRLIEGRDGSGTGDLDRLRREAASCLEKVRKRKGVFWEATLARLEPILAHARGVGVAFCAENREKADELPIDHDFPELLQRHGPGSGLAVWHDTGHAHLKEKMGWMTQEAILAASGPRLAGFHIHDVRGFKDHLPPGTGEIDFGMVAKFVRPEHIVVLELNPRLHPTDVVESKVYLERTLG